MRLFGKEPFFSQLPVCNPGGAESDDRGCFWGMCMVVLMGAVLYILLLVTSAYGSAQPVVSVSWFLRYHVFIPFSGLVLMMLWTPRLRAYSRLFFAGWLLTAAGVVLLLMLASGASPVFFSMTLVMLMTVGMVSARLPVSWGLLLVLIMGGAHGLISRLSGRIAGPGGWLLNGFVLCGGAAGVMACWMQNDSVQRALASCRQRVEQERILRASCRQDLARLRREKNDLQASLDAVQKDRAQAVRAHREHVRFMDQLLDTIPAPVFYKDRNGVYRGCNAVFAQRILGLPKEQITGRTVLEFPGVIPDDMAAAYHERDMALLQEPGEQLYEAEVRCVDGSRRDYVFNKATYADDEQNVAGMVGVMLDVSERKRIERELRRSQQFLRRIIDAVPELLVVKNRAHEWVMVNEAVCSYLGRDRQSLLERQTDLAVWSAEEAKDVQGVDERVFQEQQTLTEKRSIPSGDGAVSVFSIQRMYYRDAQDHEYVVWVGHDVTGMMRTMEELNRLATAIDQVDEGIVITNCSGAILYVNPGFTRITGFSWRDVVGENPRLLKSGKHDEAFYADMWHTILAGEVWRGAVINRRKDGEEYQEYTTIAPIRNTAGDITNFVAVKRDITREVNLQRQLKQAQKMESIGQLAAGIAHEINTPTQFVGDNTRFLRDGFGSLLALVVEVESLAGQDTDAWCRGREQVAKALERADWEYLQEEIPKALEQSLEGIGRIAEIVFAMKAFSHPGSGDVRLTDLNRALEDTITVARNEWKYVAALETDFDDDLPPVPCLLGEFNQCVLNLLVNASQAMKEQQEKTGNSEKGFIRVVTRSEPPWAVVTVADSGGGIPEEIRERVFDPFFTTKEVGVGTGQGLAISYDTIVNKLKGELTFDVQEGYGTTFTIKLPLAAEADDERNT